MYKTIATTLIAASALGWAPIDTAAAAPVYLALGDSITFGETDLKYQPSYGDRGYAGDYADIIGNRTGTRPKVINLAIDGETASSFMTGNGRTPPVRGRTDRILARQNLNYRPASNLVPQGQKLQTVVANQRAAGNSIDNVSITLGFNELAALTTTDNPLSHIDTTLNEYTDNYQQVLSEVRELLPNANLFLLNYYNPFPADPDSPAAPIFNAAGARLNQIIQNQASRYDAFYVDTFHPFVGHEGEYTYEDDLPAGSRVSDPFGGVLPIGDVHPNAQGYRVIAQQLAAARSAGTASVSEPSSLAGLALGLMLIAGMLWRRRPAYARRSVIA